MWRLLTTLLLVWRLLFGPGGPWDTKDDASQASREAKAAGKDAATKSVFKKRSFRAARVSKRSPRDGKPLPHGRGSVRDGASYAPSKTFDEPPSDAWKPWSAEARGTGAAHCGPWVRDDAPQYASIQVNVDHRGCNIVGDAANEPSIAIDPTDARKIVIGWRQFDTVESNFRQAGYGYSHDGGHTWVFPGSLTPGLFASDPVMAANGDGVFYYLSMALEELRLFRSLDGGVIWERPTQVAPGFVDKPWMAIDCTQGIGRGNIYVQGGGLRVTRSTNGGLSFGDPIDQWAPRFPTMCVGPDGALYIVGIGGIWGEGAKVIKSTNAPDSQQIPAFSDPVIVGLTGAALGGFAPNPGGLIGQAWIATDDSDGSTAGHVYVLGILLLSVESWLDVGFVRSTDGGLTWSTPIRINDDPEENGAWQWFAMMSVAPNGRIDAVWNDTRNYVDAPDANLSELYYSFSTDAGVTWSKNVPVSPMFDSYVGFPRDPKLGDYYHMISDNLGVNVAYAATFNGEQDVYFLRIGPWDCNGNEIPDDDDIACGGGNTCEVVPEGVTQAFGAGEANGEQSVPQVRRTWATHQRTWGTHQRTWGTHQGSYDCNANEVPDECEYRGDFDGDGVTTLRDVAALQRCFTGDTTTITDSPCRLFDLDEDETVSLSDLPAFQRVFGGP